MYVQVQRAAEALNHDDSTAAAVLDASVARPITQDATHAPDQDARNGPAEIVIPRQTVPEPVRKAQHPLPNRDIRKHVIDQVSGAFRHAAATAARAERAAFARERHEPIEPAAGAAEAREATGQPSAEQVQKLKLAMAERSPKTVNNVLTVLSTLLKKAVEWGEIGRLPCTIKLLRNPKKTMGFHDFEEYERLVVAAQRRGPEAALMVLLGGDAGLRLGEIVALEWQDADVQARRLTVERSDWLGHVTTPKSGRPRRVPMTERLTTALKAHRHLRSPRVLCSADGTPITRDQVIKAIRGSQRVAGLRQAGVHVLRHTFCSHLAMRGAPARAVQELAGHADLTTTQRYMHLSPAATEDAIRLLDGRAAGSKSPDRHGDILETDAIGS